MFHSNLAYFSRNRPFSTEYTEALSLAPDVKVLYTNRALCRIRLGNFSEAIVDCDWAMRIEPDCVKARAQTGQAYAAMGEFEKERRLTRN